MPEFLLCAAAMLVATIPLLALAWRGTLMDAVVAYEAVSAVAVMEFLLLSEGYGRPAEFEFPILLALLLLGGALVFLHALERWL